MTTIPDTPLSVADDLDKALSLIKVHIDTGSDKPVHWSSVFIDTKKAKAAIQELCTAQADRARKEYLVALRAKFDYMEANGMSLRPQADIWNQLELMGEFEINDLYEAALSNKGDTLRTKLEGK
jgi:hypothetical protein